MGKHTISICLISCQFVPRTPWNNWGNVLLIKVQRVFLYHVNQIYLVHAAIKTSLHRWGYTFSDPQFCLVDRHSSVLMLPAVRLPFVGPYIVVTYGRWCSFAPWGWESRESEPERRPLLRATENLGWLWKSLSPPHQAVSTSSEIIIPTHQAVSTSSEIIIPTHQAVSTSSEIIIPPPPGCVNIQWNHYPPPHQAVSTSSEIIIPTPPGCVNIQWNHYPHPTRLCQHPVKSLSPPHQAVSTSSEIIIPTHQAVSTSSEIIIPTHQAVSTSSEIIIPTHQAVSTSSGVKEVGMENQPASSWCLVWIPPPEKTH